MLHGQCKMRTTTTEMAVEIYDVQYQLSATEKNVKRCDAVVTLKSFGATVYWCGGQFGSEIVVVRLGT